MRYLIGHRGASGYEPENTLRSFRRAFEDGANSIELDLRMSRDGEIVVIHDRTVDRTTDGRGEVADVDLSTLRELDAGGGERIPVLNEVIHLALEYDATMFLEIKVPGICESLIQTIRSHSALGNSVVFGRELVREIREIDPEIRCTRPGRFRIGIHDLSPEAISEMHGRGLVLIHGDVDDMVEMRRLTELGLDGIITNFPRRLVEVLESMPQE